MEEESGLLSEETRSLTEQRAGHGILMVTTGGGTVFIDSRAEELCQQMSGDAEHKGRLPLAIMKMVEEISDLLKLRSHPNDWEAFKVKRVIKGRTGYIFAAGIGVPALLKHDKPRILLSLEALVPRTTSFRRLTQFTLTARETSVVECLLKGYSTQEIAESMAVKKQTVKEHIKHIMEKTNTSTRTGIIVALAGPPEISVSQAIKRGAPECDQVFSHGTRVVTLERPTLGWSVAS
ncbi:MAG TPA: helix-turn-helix transcriptional regulator [Nitrospirales bacterium]|jgi:DNA-binding CsgD family transcriptional regulator